MASVEVGGFGAASAADGGAGGAAGGGGGGVGSGAVVATVVVAAGVASAGGGVWARAALAVHAIQPATAMVRIEVLDVRRAAQCSLILIPVS